MKSEYFECECLGDEHTLRFIYDEQDNDLYATIFLNQYRSIWKRLWVAIKYAFGYKCKYGHWDIWTLKREDCKRLRKLILKKEEGEDFDISKLLEEVD